MLAVFFDKTVMIFILWFLAIYMGVYFIIELYRRPEQSQGSHMLSVSRTFDFLILSLCVGLLIMTYYTKSEEEKSQIIEDWTLWFFDEVDKPATIISTGAFIVVFYLLIYLVGIPMDYDTRPMTIYLIELFAWKTIVIAIIFVFFRMVLGISLKEFFDEWFLEIWHPDREKRKAEEAKAKEEKKDEPPKPEPPKEEVFNIQDNLYTYEDAQTVCSAYGSRLATYDEIESAYNKGAEWCNYGWSEGQMIFFPTQKKTWDKLQKTKDHKNSCGRPGVNGGYIENPYARFGINCFGVKPNPTDEEAAQLEENKKTPDSMIPKTEKDNLLEMKVKYWKEHGDKILRLNSFNSDKWSAY
jgi:hypothetical protein